MLNYLRSECGSAWAFCLWVSCGIVGLAAVFAVAAIVFKNLGWME